MINSDGSSEFQAVQAPIDIDARADKHVAYLGHLEQPDRESQEGEHTQRHGVGSFRDGEGRPALLEGGIQKIEHD